MLVEMTSRQENDDDLNDIYNFLAIISDHMAEGVVAQDQK